MMDNRRQRFLMQERQAAVMVRGGYLNYMCDRCGVNKGMECHHIFSRGRVSYATEKAKVLVNSRQLLSMLCQNCHTGSNNAHNPFVAEELLIKNINLYGYESVNTAFQKVIAQVRINVGIKMPPYQEGWKK